MIFKRGDLICSTRGGLGRIVDGKPHYGALKVRWDAHTVTEVPVERLLKVGVNIAGGVIVGLSATKGVKVKLPDGGMRWIDVADLVVNGPERVQQEATAGK